MNNVTLSGRLVYEPEPKKTESGMTVLSFRIAVQRNDKARTTDFFNCQAWNKTAEFISQYFHKGEPIELTGRLQNHNYEKSDGTKISETIINVNEVSFVLSKGNNQTCK